jgi:hypothetical protein
MTYAHSSILFAFYLHFFTPSSCKSFSASSCHLSLDLPTLFYPVAYFQKNFLATWITDRNLDIKSFFVSSLDGGGGQLHAVATLTS